MLNRAALLLRYKQPFIDWINAADPSPSSGTVTLDEVNSNERTVYLLEVDHEEALQEWFVANFEEIFEIELQGWYTDESLWPKDRTLETFLTWCTLELHTVVLDMGDTSLVDDELDV